MIGGPIGWPIGGVLSSSSVDHAQSVDATITLTASLQRRVDKVVSATVVVAAAAVRQILKLLQITVRLFQSVVRSIAVGRASSFILSTVSAAAWNTVYMLVASLAFGSSLQRTGQKQLSIGVNIASTFAPMQVAHVVLAGIKLAVQAAKDSTHSVAVGMILASQVIKVTILSLTSVITFSTAQIRKAVAVIVAARFTLSRAFAYLAFPPRDWTTAATIPEEWTAQTAETEVWSADNTANKTWVEGDSTNTSYTTDGSVEGDWER